MHGTACSTGIQSLDHFVNGMVRSYIRRYSFPKSDEEDLKQEVMLNLCRYPDKVKLSTNGDGTLHLRLAPGYSPPYLKRMVMTALNRFKEARQRSKLHDMLSFEPARPQEDEEFMANEDACLARTDASYGQFERTHDHEAMLRELKPVEAAVPRRG